MYLHHSQNMKTRLPKALVVALMAAASVATVQAKGLYAPGQIIGVDSDGQSITATVTPEEISAGNTLTVHAPNAKDGDGVLTVSVTANSGINNAVNVREGTLYVKGESTDSTLKRLTITPYFEGIRHGGAPTTVNVAGKDAVMIVDKVHIYNGAYTAMSVGGPDGSGTLIVQNGAHLDNSNGSTLFIGYPGYLGATTDEEIGWGNGHATTAGVGDDATDLSNRYVGTYYAGANDASRKFGKGAVTVKGKSSLTTAYQLTMAEGVLNIEEQSTVTISPGEWGACYLGYIDGSTSEVNIKSGSKLDLFATYVHFGYGDKSDVTVNIDGEGSQLNDHLGEATTGVRLGWREGVSTTARLNVTNKGELNVANLAAGNAAGSHDVKISIDSQSSYTGKNLTMNNGAELNNAGTTSVETTTVEGGTITNSGDWSSKTLTQNGGTMDNSGTVEVEELTLKSGVFNNSGTLNVKSQLAMSTAATLNFMPGSTISGQLPTSCTYSFTLSPENLAKANTVLAQGTSYSTSAALTIALASDTDLEVGKYMLIDARNATLVTRAATPAVVDSVTGLGAQAEDIVWEDGVLYLYLNEAYTAPVACTPLADAIQAANWGVFKSSQAFVGTLWGARNNAVVIGAPVPGGKGGLKPTAATGQTIAWGSVYSSDTHQGGSGGLGGADYSIYGAAIGAERQYVSGRSLGVAFGYDWGKVSPFSTSRVDQSSWHAALYGRAGFWNVGKKGSVAIDWSAAVGTTTSEHDELAADWSQESMQLDMRATYSYNLNARTAVSAFAGVQYYAQGDDSTSRVKADSLQNLRLQAGTGISYRATNRTTVYGELAIHNDTMRHNPSVEIDGVNYGSGANPGRLGGSVTVGAQYQLNADWSLNGSYSYEGTDNSGEHNVNVGAVYSF